MSATRSDAAGRLPERGLGLALEILEQVARGRDGLTAAEIARLVDAPRATVYRVVNSLVRDEYLVRRPDLSGFLLGARVLELATVVDAHRRPAHSDHLDRVRLATGEAVHLIGCHARGVTIIDEDPAFPISDRDTLLADPSRSAIGHLWLAEPPSQEPPPRSPHWRVSPRVADVEPICAAVAARGYAEQFGMLAPDRGCLAVPIRREGELVGVVSLSTPLSRLTLAARHVDTLRAAADSLASM